MASKHIIFDFDGTIADSMWVIISIYEELLKQKVTPELLEHIRGMSAAQAIRELKVPLWKAPKLFTMGKSIMRKRMHDVKVFEEIPELLKKLKADGHDLSVMSSNSTENVSGFLKEHKLFDYFSDVQGGVGLFAKAPALRNNLKQKGLSRETTFYVGDEARDVEGAHKAEVKIISVSWGYNTRELLESLKPDFLVDTPIEIRKIVA